MKTLRHLITRHPLPAARHCAAFAALAFFILHSTFYISRAAAQTPLLPSLDGTYYYQGYDSANNRYVFTSASGTYYYVDTSGFTNVGGANATLVPTPYRAVVAGTLTNFQFYNGDANLYTLITSTDAAGVVTTSTSYAVRSGTWTAGNVTFTLQSTSDAAAIWAAGYTGAGDAALSHPATFTGSNVSAIVNNVTAASRQALALRNGASAIIIGGTLSKTVAPGTVTITGTVVTTSTNNGIVTSNTIITTSTAFDAGASETIYLVGNQEGRGSSAYFRGENLAIIANGPGISAINMANGNTSVELYRSTITATNSPNTEGGALAGGPNSRMFMLNDQQSQGGASFYGEDITINNYQGRTFAFGYGANSITLKNSTINATGTKGAVFRWITSEGTGGSAGGNEAMADLYTSKVTLENTNVTTTAAYAPIFQQTGRLGRATVTGGILTTTGTGSPIIRLVGANDAQDESKFSGIFTNALLDAQNSSAIDLDFNTRDAANYGEDGGGISKEVTTLITTAWDFVFQSSTLNGTSAMRIANAGADTSPFSNETKFTAYDSTINGRIEMLVSAGLSTSFETTGANLTLQGFNSHFTGGFFITGTESARKIHQASLALTDCTFTGDIIGTNRGTLVIKFTNTPLTGNLNFSGATRTYLDLVNTPISGGITLAGSALMMNSPGLDLNNRRALILNSPIAAGISLAGSSSLDLTLSGSASILSGGIAAKDNATATLRLENNSSINGGVSVSGSSSLTLVLSSLDQLSGDLAINDRARLALATFAGTPINLDRTISLAGIWGITGKTTLAGNLAITHPLGTIAIDNAAQDSLTLASGMTGNGRLDILSIDGATLGTAEIRVIHDSTGNFIRSTPNPLILARPVDYGLAAYTLQNRADGAYLVGGLDAGAFGAGGAAVFNSQSLAVEDWFAGLTPINDRLEQLRQSNIAAHAAGDTRATGDTGALWLKAHAGATQVDRSSPSLNFTSRTLALAAGVDARWDYPDAYLTTGIYAETTRTDRDFIGSADGRSTGAGAGAYASYHRHNGLYASLIARFAVYENTLNTNSPNNALSASYHSQTAGLAAEAGWRILRADGWWFEPAYQLALAALPGVSYTTDSTQPLNRIPIQTGGARAIQNSLRLSFGRAIGKGWDFNGRALVAHIAANGGKFTAPGLREADFTIHGLRAEAALGLSHPVWRHGRLTLDAVTVLAADYKRPCALTLGYTHQW